MKWLLLDVSFLCWRLYHSGLKKLSYKEVPTGVLYGFVRDFVSFQDFHYTNNVAFCFDARELLRKEVSPGYKSTREKLRAEESPEEKKSRQGLMNQINTLRTDFLPEIGYANIFHADGFEADDVIASLCKNKKDEDEYIIISRDADLLQLLSPTVSMYNPGNQTTTTLETFEGAWGIQPHQWPLVKAIAGCSSDDIVGVDGVAEKTAVRFLRKELNRKTKTYQRIKKSKHIAKANLPLVKLPYKGTPIFTLQQDTIDPKVWSKVLSRFGMRSIRSNPPRTTRKGFHSGKES